MRHVSLAGFLAAVIGSLWAAPVLAGGWAVTTLDSLPSTLQAGQTYQMGYVIRQHGTTPFSVATPTIRISLDGQQLSFPGEGQGAPGHYVSQVRFPSAGTWTWVVDQTPFATQQLGVVQVAEPHAVVTTDPAVAKRVATNWSSATISTDARLIPWAWGWLAVGGFVLVAVVGWRSRLVRGLR